MTWYELNTRLFGVFIFLPWCECMSVLLQRYSCDELWSAVLDMWGRGCLRQVVFYTRWPFYNLSNSEFWNTLGPQDFTWENEDSARRKSEVGWGRGQGPLWGGTLERQGAEAWKNGPGGGDHGRGDLVHPTNPTSWRPALRAQFCLGAYVCAFPRSGDACEVSCLALTDSFSL